MFIFQDKEKQIKRLASKTQDYIDKKPNKNPAGLAGLSISISGPCYYFFLYN